MRTVYSLLVLSLAGSTGCYSQGRAEPIEPSYPEPIGQSSGPTYEGYQQASAPQQSWSGPPGGAIDPGYGYQDPNMPGYPEGYPDGNAPQGTDGEGGYVGGYADPNAQAADQGYGGAAADAQATAEVTDAEIDVTLDAYGEWIEDGDYGRVWRPYNTVVGADFTPYDSCGQWVDSDYGWTFQSCNEWSSWGWLPFHYGRWVSVDDSWCWMRDYTWGPGWVEWRDGGGYVGWRPLSPTRVIRDHRDRFTGPAIRDHRTGARGNRWNFANQNDFGHGRGHNAAGIKTLDGLRATTSVAQPGVRGDHRTRAANVMAGRRDRGPWNGATSRPGGNRQNFGTYNPPRGATYNPPPRTYQPNRNFGGMNNPPRNSYNPPPSRTYQPNRNFGTNAPPVRNYAPSRNYTPPVRNYAPPSRSYSPPSRSYSPPSRSYSPPSRSYSPPSRSYSPPSRSYSPPSRSSGSYSAPSRSSSPPSRSSGSSGGGRGSSGGGGHSSSGGGHSGGGRHR